MFFFTFTMALAVGGGVANAAPYGHTAPKIGITDPGPCGSSHITATGSGFSPNEVVSIYRDGSLLTSVTASSTGTISQQITLAAVGAGTHTVSATGKTNGLTASSYFVVQTKSCAGVDTSTVAKPVTTNASGLAFTGTEVGALGGIAAVALFAGIVLVVLGRRRA